MNKRQKTQLIAVVLAIVVGAYAIARVANSRSQTERSRAERAASRESAVSESRKLFGALPMVQLSELSTAASVAQVLSVAAPGNPPPDGRAVREIVDFVASFIYYRFVNTSVEEYNSWRRAEGYAFKKVEDIYDMPGDYEFFLKELPPPDASVEDLFEAMWPLSLELFDGANKPVAIAADALGINITFGTARLSDGAGPLLDGGLGHEIWIARTTARLRGWWAPASHGMSFQDMLLQYDTVKCATVGIIFQFESGVRRPIILLFVLDPTDHVWRLQEASAAAFARDDLVSPLEY